jgi:hypothetical protein
MLTNTHVKKDEKQILVQQALFLLLVALDADRGHGKELGQSGNLPARRTMHRATSPSYL